MEISMDFYHHTVRKAGKDVPMHNHKCYELVYYAKGSGWTTIADNTHAYGPNRFAIVHPRTLHDEKHREDTEVMFVGFVCDGGALPELEEGVHEDFAGHPVFHLMQRMAAEMRQQQAHYMNMLNALTNELAVLLLRSAKRNASPPPLHKIQYAKAFIDEHFTQKIDFSALARQSGYSADRFRHLFKDLLGCSPTQYILHKRLSFAKLLLVRDGLNVSAVALECGFSNDAQFCSLFKRETGATPGAYRRQHGGSG